MRRVSGTFNGTGAGIYICCGFLPDAVKIYNAEDSEAAVIRWNRNMRAAEMVEGVMQHGTGQAPTLYTAGTGIRPYVGGVLLTSTLQTSVVYGEGEYQRREQKDYRFAKEDADLVDINEWTLTTSGSRSGKFNTDVAAAALHIGEGSQIQIGNDARKEWFIIESVSAGAGKEDDEVVLNYAAQSGVIYAIRGMYDFSALPVGRVTPAGFYLAVTSDINVNDEMQCFEAEQWDND